MHTEGDHIYWEYPEWIRDPPPDTSLEAAKKVIQEVIPRGATALVAGLWSEPLMSLEDRTVHPFPQGGDGSMVQLDDPEVAAVEQLEQMRSEGAEYLVFPKVQLWFLEYKAPELQEHVESRYRAVLRDRGLRGRLRSERAVALSCRHRRPRPGHSKRRSRTTHRAVT